VSRTPASSTRPGAGSPRSGTATTATAAPARHKSLPRPLLTATRAPAIAGSPLLGRHFGWSFGSSEAYYQQAKAREFI
jgi:hypothetical protein